MNWSVSEELVCGGVRINDEFGRSAAVVTQRDNHPTLGGGVSPDDAMRRARLMAASPDLLEALERLVSSARDVDHGYMDQAIDNAESAIARARGEA